MIFHHYITRYIEDGTRYAESWLQINFLGWSWCFSRKRILVWPI